MGTSKRGGRERRREEERGRERKRGRRGGERERARGQEEDERTGTLTEMDTHGRRGQERTQRGTHAG